MRKSSLIFILAIMLPILASAHHSRAYYSEEQQEFEGEIVEIFWRNPHISFSIRRLDDEGGENWRVEAASIYMLNRTGVTEDLFSVGDRISVVGFESARQQRDFLATNMLLASGREAMLMPSAQPYFGTAGNVGGRGNWQLDESVLDSVAAEGKGILRVWSIPRQGGREQGRMLLTESAQAAVDQWDPLESLCIEM